MKLEAFQQ